MTDLPPPPSYGGTPQPPPPAYGAPPPAYGAPPPAYGYPPQAPGPYPQYVFPPGAGPAFTPKPPRPKARVGSLLIIGGAIFHMISVWLPWYSFEGQTFNGTDTYLRDYGADTFESPGYAWLVMGTIMLGLGIAAYFAGRQTALAIVTLLMGVLGGLISLVGIAAVEEHKKAVEFVDAGSTGVGAYTGIVAMVIAIAGAIVVLATPRRMPPMPAAPGIPGMPPAQSPRGW